MRNRLVALLRSSKRRFRRDRLPEVEHSHERDPLPLEMRQPKALDGFKRIGPEFVPPKKFVNKFDWD